MGIDRTFDTSEATPQQICGAQTFGQSQSVSGNLVRTQNRHSLGRPAPRNGLWVRHDLLATLKRMGAGWGLVKVTRSLANQTPRGRPTRLVTGGGGQHFGASSRGGEKTGPNPTDRAKAGTKHHLITEAQGIPLVALVTGANIADISQLLPLVDALPSLRGQRGRPGRRPKQVLADRGYDSNAHRRALRARAIQPQLGRRRTAHGSGLGTQRWVIERTVAWLHQFRRLRIRFERYANIHQAFLSIGCSLICLRFLKNSFC
jgi:transposase